MAQGGARGCGQPRAACPRWTTHVPGSSCRKHSLKPLCKGLLNAHEKDLCLVGARACLVRSSFGQVGGQRLLPGCGQQHWDWECGGTASVLSSGCQSQPPESACWEQALRINAKHRSWAKAASWSAVGSYFPPKSLKLSPSLATCRSCSAQ